MTDNLPTLDINRDRLDADLKRIAEFTDPDPALHAAGVLAVLRGRARLARGALP